LKTIPKLAELLALLESILKFEKIHRQSGKMKISLNLKVCNSHSQMKKSMFLNIVCP